MEEAVYKQIKLENAHTLNLLDKSRKIAADAYVVKLRAEIEVEIKKELFSDPFFAEKGSTDIAFNDIVAVLGDKVTYAYEIERNFIMTADKELVFESLVNTFMENLGQYVQKPQFPGKFVLKVYKDKTK